MGPQAAVFPGKAGLVLWCWPLRYRRLRKPTPLPLSLSLSGCLATPSCVWAVPGPWGLGSPPRWSEFLLTLVCHGLLST
jgi:hypothetical protein